MAKRNSNVVGISSGRDEQEEALRFASLHVLSILDKVPAFVSMECGETDRPECFNGKGEWTDMIVALVVRCRDITSAMAYALDGEVSAANLKAMVVLGDPVDHDSG